MTNITPQAQAAQDAARKASGEFGTQDHADPGIVIIDPKSRNWGEWADRGDLDDYDTTSNGCQLTGVQVAYDPEGFAAVSVDVRSSSDEYMWHVGHYLGEDLTGERVQTQPGMAVREAWQDWLNDGASSLMDELLCERYGCGTECANGFDPSPTFVWYSTEPGVLTDEQICNAAHDASLRYRNEKDPGTDNCPYPWHDWVKAAIVEFGNPLGETDAA